MPYAAPLLDDENDPNKNPSGGVNISGQSTTVSTGVPGQEAAVPGAKQKTSGNYTNIQSYLDANKEQGDAMGTKIAGDVTSKADDATSKIGAYESNAPSVKTYDPNEAIGRATSLSDEEKATYKTNKATGGYSGPQTADGIEGYQDANKSGTEAVGLVQKAGNESGQRELLKQTYNRPQYSAGENNLDQALVQNSAGSKAKLEGITQKYSGLNDYLNNANTKVGNAVNAAGTQALKNKQAFNPAETAARNALVNPIQQRAEQAWTDNKALAGRVQDDATDEILSAETLAALGLSDGQSLYDLNLSNYVTPDLTQVGMNNVAKGDERNKYAALSALFDDPTMNQITSDGKEISPVKFDKASFDKDFAGKDKEYKEFYNNGSRGYFDNYLAANPQTGTFRAGITPQLKSMSLSEIESVLLPQQQAVVDQMGPEFAEITTKPIQKYLEWAKNSMNVNKKITKG